jgi:hypothetical protein
MTTIRKLERRFGASRQKKDECFDAFDKRTEWEKKKAMISKHKQLQKVRK